MPLRRSLIVLGTMLFATVAVAQQRPDTAASTGGASADTSYAIVFSEDIMSNAPRYVTLTNHTAYRVDVIFEGDVRLPVGAFTIELRGGGAAPLVLHATENPSLVEGGESFVIAPTVTGEYRMVLYYTGTPTHIRIVRDPHELALLQGRAKPSLGMLTLDARGIWLSGARTIAVSPYGIVHYQDGAVVAWEGCLGLERGRFASLPKLGGCLMTFGRYFQSGNGPVLQMIGTNPDYLVAHKLGADVAASAVVVFGRASQGSGAEVSYWILGGGVDAAWKLFGVQALELTLSPAIADVHQGGFNIPGPPAHDSPSHDVLGLRLTAGLEVHL